MGAYLPPQKPFGESAFCAIAPFIPSRTAPGRCAFTLFSFRSRAALQVLVRDNNVDQALKALKKKLQREGVFREMKLRRHYEKPSERRAREAAEAVRRARKMERKRIERLRKFNNAARAARPNSVKSLSHVCP
jgi:small subunit ribosomal protein S21